MGLTENDDKILCCCGAEARLGYMPLARPVLRTQENILNSSQRLIGSSLPKSKFHKRNISNLPTVCLQCSGRPGSQLARPIQAHRSASSQSKLVVIKGSYKILGAHGHSTCKVTKKYRRSRLHSVKRKEYKKLRQMLPSLQEKEKVSKVEVIEGAIRYIDELHDALIQRFRARGLPALLNGVKLNPNEIDSDNIRELIRKLLASANPGSLPPTRIENVRTTPSFLQKMTRNRKS